MNFAISIIDNIGVHQEIKIVHYFWASNSDDHEHGVMTYWS